MINYKLLTPDIFWKNVDAERLLSNLSWNELLRRIGVNEKNISNMKKGLPNIKTILHLSEILNCDLECFFLG